jgi:hypothetical protein
MDILAKIRSVGIAVLPALLALGTTANAGYRDTEVDPGGSKIREILATPMTVDRTGLREQLTEADELLQPGHFSTQMLAMIDLATPANEFSDQSIYELIWTLGSTTDPVLWLTAQPTLSDPVFPREFLSGQPSVPPKTIGNDNLRFNSGHLRALLWGVLLSAGLLGGLVVLSRSRRFWRMIRALGRSNRCDPFYRYFY